MEILLLVGKFTGAGVFTIVEEADVLEHLDVDC